MNCTYTTERIVSDKDTHFTGDIAQNAMEVESIDFPTDWATCGIQKIRITNVTLVSDMPAGAPLNWDVIFWATSDAAHASDIDSDDFIQMLEFEEVDARESPGGTDIFYYKSQEDIQLPIDYVDKDNTSKLHVGLVNRSVTTFDPTAPGVDRVKIIVVAEPIL